MKIKEKINSKSTSCYKRNEAILFRHYFWASIKKLNKETVLENLNREFYISLCTIQEILYDNKLFIKELKSKKVKLEFLKKKFEFSNWDL